MFNQEIMLKALLNILTVVSVYILLTAFLGKSKKTKAIIFICYAVFYFLITFAWLYVGLPLVITSSLLSGIIAMSFLHNASFAKKLSSAAITYAILILVENAVATLFINENIDFFERVKYDTIAILIIVKSLSFIISIFIHSVFTNQSKINLPSKYYFTFPLIMILSSILSMFLIANYGDSSVNTFLIISTIIIINYVAFSMYNDILNLFEEKYNNISLEKQYELIKTQSENIEKSADELRRLEHDLKNKLTPIAFMVKDENIDQVSEYIQKIMAEFSSKRILKSSGVTELDSIINIKMNKCGDLDIEFEYEISPIENAFVNNMDLAVMAGILLDNAIEATLKFSQKWIKADIRIVKSVLIIEIENTFDGVIKKNGNRFLTRKENKEYHGMGIRNIESILKKYDGEITFDYTGNVFKALVIVYPK
ncbi:MAG: GHKL domain-containing protein [Tissierellia bacterium]|nr:GHKL domain-containing protein [Tissierellia bacterium]